MRKNSLQHVVVTLFGLASIASSMIACDENPSTPPLGSMDITTSAPSTAAAAPLQTVDGWSIKFDRYLVHVSAVSVVGIDGVVAASATPQIIDHAAPGSKSLLSATVRTARHWEDVSFQIAPADATATATPLDPATDEDRDMMEKEGLSLYIEATATKADVTKTLKLGFKSATTFKTCEGDLGGARVRGLVVPPDGNDTADVVMGAEVLFSDDLGAPGAVLRADAIAAADIDNDGIITTDDLHGVPLDVARQTSSAGYLVGVNSTVIDLGAFLEALTRHTVKSFRSPTGTCVAEADAAPSPQ
jgi:hypothetical protein